MDSDTLDINEVDFTKQHLDYSKYDGGVSCMIEAVDEKGNPLFSDGRSHKTIMVVHREDTLNYVRKAFETVGKINSWLYRVLVNCGICYQFGEIDEDGYSQITMATGGEYIVIGPAFVEFLHNLYKNAGYGEKVYKIFGEFFIAYVLIHEVYHILRDHSIDYDMAIISDKDRYCDHERANIAMDYQINYAIKNYTTLYFKKRVDNLHGNERSECEKDVRSMLDLMSSTIFEENRVCVKTRTLYADEFAGMDWRDIFEYCPTKYERDYLHLRRHRLFDNSSYNSYYNIGVVFALNKILKGSIKLESLISLTYDKVIKCDDPMRLHVESVLDAFLKNKGLSPKNDKNNKATYYSYMEDAVKAGYNSSIIAVSEVINGKDYNVVVKEMGCLNLYRGFIELLKEIDTMKKDIDGLEKKNTNSSGVNKNKFEKDVNEYVNNK